MTPPAMTTKGPDLEGRRGRRGARAVAALTVTIGLWMWMSLGLAGVASAHDVLISSNPADGATLAAAPSSLVFTFDQPVQNFDPVVSLIGPDQKQYATGSPQISGNTVTGTVSAGPAGAYIGAYRVVSVDGHPVTGQIKFTVAAVASSGPAAGSASTVPVSPGSSTGPNPSPTDPASGGTSAVSAAPAITTASGPVTAGGVATPSSGGLSAGIWIGLVVAVLLIAAAVVILLRRPSKDEPGTD